MSFVRTWTITRGAGARAGRPSSGWPGVQACLWSSHQARAGARAAGEGARPTVSVKNYCGTMDWLFASLPPITKTSHRPPLRPSRLEPDTRALVYMTFASCGNTTTLPSTEACCFPRSSQRCPYSYCCFFSACGERPRGSRPFRGSALPSLVSFFLYGMPVRAHRVGGCLRRGLRIVPHRVDRDLGGVTFTA